MKQSTKCQYCNQYFEWETGTFLVLPHNTKLAPWFCSEECQEASENEIDRKRDRSKPDVVQFLCRKCGGEDFSRRDSEWTALKHYSYEFECKECHSLWEVDRIHEYNTYHKLIILQGGRVKYVGNSKDIRLD